MIIQYFTFGISIAIISWMVGLIINSVLRRTKYYQSVSSLNLIKSKALNNKIGLGLFKWIVKNTFFRYFNPKLKLKNKIDIAEIIELREEMTFAEVNHLIGFVFVIIFILVKIVNGLYLFAAVILIVNILLNLYPSLLQQENKRRIDEFLRKYS
jgi:hypothetical protein